MRKRRRRGLTGLLVCAWVALAVIDLLNGWHGYYVAISFVLAVAVQVTSLGHRPSGEQGEPEGPWPDKALFPELLRRRRERRSGR